MRASQFIKEGIDSDAVNELDTYIMNNEDLYRRRFMPIISNIKRKMKKNVYDHEKAQKLWMYLVDDAAKQYVKEFGSTQDDVATMFPKETRQQVARIISDSMDEIGLAIDEIDERWPGGPTGENSPDIKATCGGLELFPGPNGEKVARQLFSGFSTTRVRGRWQVYWGRILW